MNLRHIEIFHAVYVNRSVSAAARALNVSQPAVTATLRHAEQNLGFSLFSRVRGRLIATEDAHHLFGDVDEIYGRIEMLRQASRNIARGRGATLRLASLPSLGLGLLPDAVARFLDRRPETVFDLGTVNHDEISRRLSERETDVAIAFQPPEDPQLVAQCLGSGELGVLFRTGDFAGERTRVGLFELPHHNVISLEQSGPIGVLLRTRLEEAKIGLKTQVSARTFYIATALVARGVGVSVVDNFTAKAATGAGLEFLPLDPPIAFDVNAVHLEGRPPSVAMREFLHGITAQIGMP